MFITDRLTGHIEQTFLMLRFWMFCRSKRRSIYVSFHLTWDPFDSYKTDKGNIQLTFLFRRISRSQKRL